MTQTALFRFAEISGSTATVGSGSGIRCTGLPFSTTTSVPREMRIVTSSRVPSVGTSAVSPPRSTPEGATTTLNSRFRIHA